MKVIEFLSCIQSKMQCIVGFPIDFFTDLLQFYKVLCFSKLFINIYNFRDHLYHAYDL